MGNSRSNYFKDLFTRQQLQMLEVGNDNLLGSFNIVRLFSQPPVNGLLKVLDLRVYDEYTDITEAIRKLNQEHPQMSSLLFVCENKQNPELYNLAFEYGEPLNTYIYEEPLLWSYIEQVVEGLLFLEGQGYHYPALSKQYVLLTGKGTVKLLSPYAFSDFMREILQIYLNPQNPMSNRKSHFLMNIHRNIKELGITVATLVSNCNEYQLKTDPNYVNKVIDAIGTKFSKGLVGLIRALIQNNGQLKSIGEVKQLVYRMKTAPPGDLGAPGMPPASSSSGQGLATTPMPKQPTNQPGIYAMNSPQAGIQGQAAPPKPDPNSGFKNPGNPMGPGMPGQPLDDRKPKIFEDKLGNKLTNSRVVGDFGQNQSGVYQNDPNGLKKLAPQPGMPLQGQSNLFESQTNQVPPQFNQPPPSTGMPPQNLTQSGLQQSIPNLQPQNQPQIQNLVDSQLAQSGLQQNWQGQPQGQAKLSSQNQVRATYPPQNPALANVPPQKPVLAPQMPSPGPQPISQPVPQPVPQQALQQPPQPMPQQMPPQVQPPIQNGMPPQTLVQPPQPQPPQIQPQPQPQPQVQPNSAPQIQIPPNQGQPQPNVQAPPQQQMGQPWQNQTPQKQAPQMPEERTDRVRSMPQPPSNFDPNMIQRKTSLNAEPIIHSYDKPNFMFVNSPDPMNVDINSFFKRRESLGGGLTEEEDGFRSNNFFDLDEPFEQTMGANKLQPKQLTPETKLPEQPAIAQIDPQTGRPFPGPISMPKQPVQDQSKDQPQQMFEPVDQRQTVPGPQLQVQPQISPQSPIATIQQQPPQPQIPERQKMITKMHIKWLPEEKRHQKIVEYDDKTSEEIPFTDEERTKFISGPAPVQTVAPPKPQTSMQSQPQFPGQVQSQPPGAPHFSQAKPVQPSAPAFQQPVQQARDTIGKASHVISYNIPGEMSAGPDTFMVTSQVMQSCAHLCLFPEGSSNSVLLFRSKPLNLNNRFNDAAQVVNRRDPLAPSIYHNVEQPTPLQNSALFSKREGSMTEPFHIKKDDYHKPVSMENLPRVDKPSMPTVLSTNARLIKKT